MQSLIFFWWSVWRRQSFVESDLNLCMLKAIFVKDEDIDAPQAKYIPKMGIL